MRKLLLALFAFAVLAVVRIPQAHATPFIILDPSAFADTEACTQASGCPESEMTAMFTWYWKINISSVTVGDTDNFSIVSTNCSGTMYIDCNVYLAFHPKTPDHLETTLLIQYTDSKGVPGTAKATLRGNGFVPALEIVPVWNNFGPKALNSEKEWMYAKVMNHALIDIGIESITMASLSNAAFGVDQECVTTLPPDGSCIMGMSFEPTDASAVNSMVYGWITLTSQYEEDEGVGLQGYVLAADQRDLNYSKSEIGFGTETVGGASSAQTFAITNVGVPDVDIASIVSNSAEFPVTHDCPATLAHGLSCTVSTTFEPTVAGAREGTVTITSNAPDVGTTFDVSLSGVGVDPDRPTVKLSTSSLDFGDQTIGATEHLSVILTNEGGAALTVTTVTTDAPFGVETDCDDNVVAPNGRCSIIVAFTPTAVGDVTGTITINDDASDTPQTVNLKGNGTQAATPVASLSANSIDFGAQAVGSTTTQSLTITNTGTSDLSISLTTLDGEGVEAYSKTDGCRETALEPNAACTIDFLFTPTTPGTTYVAALSIADNAADSPQSVTITGSGVASSGGGGSCQLSGGVFGLSGGAAVTSALALLVGLRLVRSRKRR